MVFEDTRKLEEKRKGGPTFKAQFDALLDAAVDAIILMGGDGKITQFNHAAERLFGYRADEVIGRNVNCLMPEPYKAEHDGYLHRYQTTGEARIIGIGREVVARRKDGSIFPVELSVGEAKREGARGFVGIIRDITQRKDYEERLRQQSEELRLTFEAAPTPIIITSPTLEIIGANRAMVELLQCTEQDLQGLNCRSLVVSDDIGSFVATSDLVDSGRPDTGYRAQIRLSRKDSSIVSVAMYAGAVRDADGVAQFIVISLVDRTSVVEAEREAIDLRNRLAHVSRINTLGEMATGIAHELNQPLSAITNYANASRRLISSGQAGLSEIVDALEKIAAQAERAGEVIRRLRSMLVRRDHNREPVNASQLVRDVMRLAELELRERNIHLRLDLPEELPKIKLDPVQLQQVLLNLIRNAMDAMAETSVGAEIAIAARHTDDGVIEISVSDAGPGISDAIAKRLFEPFYTTKPQGLGMGLAICRSIVQAHGGSLSFFNNRYGGVTFVIRLPLQPERIQQ